MWACGRVGGLGCGGVCEFVHESEDESGSGDVGVGVKPQKRPSLGKPPIWVQGSGNATFGPIGPAIQGLSISKRVAELRVQGHRV